MATTQRYPSSFAMAELERFPPDDPREWLNRARSSLRLARDRPEGVYLEDLCYQAQEASEKAIKAVMISRGVRFPRVHRLKQLLDILHSAGFLVPPELRPAASAAAFRPRERYPGKRVTDARYLHALDGAGRIVDWAVREVGISGWTGAVREPLAIAYAGGRPTHGSGSPEPSLLAVLVDRIVGIADPERIILFGSGARGTMRADSDLDVMVVRSDPFDEDALEDAIAEALADLPLPIDVILATPGDLERYGRSWCLVYCPALEEGRVLYEQERGFPATAGGAPTA